MTGAYPQCLAYACSRVVEKQQQGMIAPSIATPAINGAYYSPSFFRLQIDCGPTNCFLVANRENATILTCPCHILPQEMLHKTANRSKTAIPGNRGVPAARFDMI